MIVKRKPNFPYDWILPGEFSFGSTGHYDSMRFGTFGPQNQIPISEEESKAIRVYRDLLALERKRRGVMPLFWCIGKPKDKMTPQEWEEWFEFNQFTLYEVDYPNFHEGWSAYLIHPDDPPVPPFMITVHPFGSRLGLPRDHWSNYNNPHRKRWPLFNRTKANIESEKERNK